MSQKKNRFSPIGPALDTLFFSFLSTLGRFVGITGKYTPPKSPTSDFYILTEWFLESYILIFIFIYFLHIIGVYPTGGMFLEHRKSKTTKPQSKDKQESDAKKRSDGKHRQSPLEGETGRS